MIRHNILLSVSGIHMAGEDKNDISFFTEGWITHENGKYIIEYDEGALSGDEGSLTRLTIEGDKIELKQVGGYNTEFIFNKSQMFETAYDTPFGFMSMSVFPLDIKSKLKLHSGEIKIEYIIKSGIHNAVNKLVISYFTPKHKMAGPGSGTAGPGIS